MGMSLWGVSPLYENLKVFIVIMDTNKTTSRRQGRLREEGSEGSRSATDNLREPPRTDRTTGTMKPGG